VPPTAAGARTISRRQGAGSADTTTAQTGKRKRATGKETGGNKRRVGTTNPGTASRAAGEPSASHPPTGVTEVPNFADLLHRHERPHPVPMPAGTLTLEGSKFRGEDVKILVHTGRYTPTAGAGGASDSIVGSGYFDFLPVLAADEPMSRDKVDSLVSAFQDPVQARAIPPIQVMLTADGKLLLTDGHHRLVAAVRAGATVNVEINPDTEQFLDPSGDDWSNVRCE
jgi:hypothetical protein